MTIGKGFTNYEKKRRNRPFDCNTHFVLHLQVRSLRMSRLPRKPNLPRSPRPSHPDRSRAPPGRPLLLPTSRTCPQPTPLLGPRPIHTKTPSPTTRLNPCISPAWTLPSTPSHRPSLCSTRMTSVVWYSRS